MRIIGRVVSDVNNFRCEHNSEHIVDATDYFVFKPDNVGTCGFAACVDYDEWLRWPK